MLLDTVLLERVGRVGLRDGLLLLQVQLFQILRRLMSRMFSAVVRLTLRGRLVALNRDWRGDEVALVDRCVACGEGSSSFGAAPIGRGSSISSLGNNILSATRVGYCFKYSATEIGQKALYRNFRESILK
jgi:hypothetical protein